MTTPRIRHIALNVQDRDKCAEYYKTVFGMKETLRGENNTIYLSDGFVNLALISSPTEPTTGAPRNWGLHHIGFQVDSVDEIAKVSGQEPKTNVFAAVAEKFIHDPEGNRTDASEHGWPI